MLPKEVLLAVAVVTALVFAAFLLVFFSLVRLWVQALLTNTPVSILDILRLKLRRIPTPLVVHAAIALSQRGVRVPVREVEECYLASVTSGEPATSAAELAALVEEARRKESGAREP